MEAYVFCMSLELIMYIKYKLILFFTVYIFVQRPNLGLVRLIVEVTRPHAIRNTNRIRFL